MTDLNEVVETVKWLNEQIQPIIGMELALVIYTNKDGLTYSLFFDDVEGSRFCYWNSPTGKKYYTQCCNEDALNYALNDIIRSIKMGNFKERIEEMVEKDGMAV